MELIEKAKKYAQELFARDFSGHDYFHTLRVYRMATYLAGEEKAELRIVQLAALLHDVDDRKLSPQTWEEKANARRFLQENHVDSADIARICRIIGEVSYAGKDSVIPTTPEGKCVQDADRLDAIGAIGIARAFAYGGNHNRLMYHPDIGSETDMGREAYYRSESTTLNHFYEKLLRLKDLMNTPTARRLAKDRHRYLEEYIAQFLAEWDALR